MRVVVNDKISAFLLQAGQSWSLGQNLRDRDETLALRDRDLEQKLETRPRLERAETNGVQRTTCLS